MEGTCSTYGALHGPLEDENEKKRDILCLFLLFLSSSFRFPLFGFNQALDYRHVLKIIMIIFPRSFHDSWKMRKAGIVHNISESLNADMAFADMPVSVLAGTQGYLGVIQMNEKKPFKAHKAMKFPDGGVKSLSA